MPKNYDRYVEIMKANGREFSCEYEACEQLSFELNDDEEEGDEDE